MAQNLKGHYAGFVSRLVAFTIDIAIVVILLIVGGWLIQTVNSFFQVNLPFQLPTALLAAIAAISAFLVSATYFIFFWTLTGQTPGKLLLGLRVIGVKNDQITLWQAIRRYVGYYLSALALYAGYLWVLIDNRRQGWHDKLAGTYVVYFWEARPDAYIQARLNERQGAEESSGEVGESAP
jgi:uncharacterized RDD family membrane protein YckC